MTVFSFSKANYKKHISMDNRIWAHYGIESESRKTFSRQISIISVFRFGSFPFFRSFNVERMDKWMRIAESRNHGSLQTKNHHPGKVSYCCCCCGCCCDYTCPVQH